MLIEINKSIRSNKAGFSRETCAREKEAEGREEGAIGGKKSQHLYSALHPGCILPFTSDRGGADFITA